MSTKGVRKNREYLLHDEYNRPLYNVRFHVESEKVNVTMSRKKGRYYVSDALPCRLGSECDLEDYPFRLTKKDNDNIAIYIDAFYKQLDEKEKSRSVRLGGGAKLFKVNKHGIPKPSLNGGKKNE